MFKQSDNITDNNAAGFVAANLTDDGAVEFNDVNGDLTQIVDITVAGTEIIQRYLKSLATSASPAH